MSCILRHCAKGGVLPIAIGVGLTLLLQPDSVRADKTDISRILAGAEKGSIKNQVELGAAYFVGRGVTQDEKRSAYWYERAANSGDPVAQKQIGYFYQVGIGVPRDTDRAVRWYERAAASGLISAKVNLGVAYLWGLGVRRDPELSVQLFREAAEKGDGLGACYLGDMYYSGHGVDKDEATAQHWYEIGTRLHDPMSEYRLGILVSADRSNAQLMKKAAQLFRDSAGAGYVPSMHALGLLLVRDPELTSSPSEAASLLEEASEAGSWKSSVTLAILSRDGKGVPVDKRAAYYRFVVAKLQGGTPASNLVANDVRVLAGQLGAKQTGELDAEATAWFEKHHLPLEFVYKDGDNWKKFPLFAVQYPESDVHAGKLVPKPPA
jgi:TPR repeat protein